MFRFSLAAVLVLLTLQNGAMAGSPSVEGFPPVVVRTFPTSGDQGVDPSIREVRVTFSKDMMTHEMWSFVHAAPAPFPSIAGAIRYLEDNRTCVLPVSLEPGKTYGMWINSEEHTSFRDTYQHPAVPYLLVFKTHD